MGTSNNVVSKVMGKFFLVFIFALFGVFYSCDGQVRVNGNLKERPDGKDDFNFNNGVKALKAQIDSLNNEIIGLERIIETQVVLIEESRIEILSKNQTIISNEIEINRLDSLNQVRVGIINEKNILVEQLESEKGQMLNELEQYKIAVENQTKEIDLKSVEIDSLIVLLNEKPTEIRDTVYTEIRDTIFLDKIITKVPDPRIDTIITISDPILLDFTDSLVQPTDEANVYVMVMGIGLVHLQDVDTIYRFQRHYEIERTIDYAETRDQPTTYRNIGLPFQFRGVEVVNTNTNSVRIMAHMTEQCKIQYGYKKVGEAGLFKTHPVSSDSFDAGEISPIEFRHTRTLDGLEPATEYGIQIFITSEKGHIDVWDLIVKTL